MNKKLEIGVLLNNYFLPSWEYKIIEELAASDYARLALVLIKKAGRQECVKGSYFFRFHRRIDQMVFLGRDNYSEKKNTYKLLKHVPSIMLNNADYDESEQPGVNTIDEIRKYRLDIIINLGYGLIKGKILNIPEYGVWSFSMNKYDSREDDTSGYYEIIRSIPVTISELLVLKDGREGDQVISRTIESTYPFSISLNRDKLMKRSSLTILRVIKESYGQGGKYLKNLEERFVHGSSDGVEHLQAPSFYQAFINFLCFAIILLRKVSKKIYYSDPFSWVLLFNIGSSNNFLKTNYGSFRELKPGKDKFWADPFVVRNGDKYFVFVEEFIYRTNKGHIAVLELDSNGKLQNAVRIIEKSYHLSYPFVFENGGDYYMIPETGQNRTIDLYRSTEFPFKWEFVKTIMDGLNSVDTTLFYYNKKWWLFTLIDKIEFVQENSPELYLFFSDDLFSDSWASHPLNPVVTDVRSARPAGRIFISEGKIYRPSQDCSVRYGQAFNINQVLHLSETEYEEMQVLNVTPSWKKELKGTHTFNFDGELTIIDAYAFRKRIPKYSFAFDETSM